MARDFGDRENTRVRDLLDLILLIENEMLDRDALSAAVHDVWRERDASAPPSALPELPASWPDGYERLAADHDLTAQTFAAALAVVTALWADLNIEER
jgi:hypothetical protein